MEGAECDQWCSDWRHGDDKPEDKIKLQSSCHVDICECTCSVQELNKLMQFCHVHHHA